MVFSIRHIVCAYNKKIIFSCDTSVSVGPDARPSLPRQWPQHPGHGAAWGIAPSGRPLLGHGATRGITPSGPWPALGHHGALPHEVGSGLWVWGWWRARSSPGWGCGVLKGAVGWGSKVAPMFTYISQYLYINLGQMLRRSTTPCYLIRGKTSRELTPQPQPRRYPIWHTRATRGTPQNSLLNFRGLSLLSQNLLQCTHCNSAALPQEINMRLHLDLINIDADTIEHIEIEDLADLDAAHAYAQSAGDCVLFEVRDAAEQWEGADEDLYAYAVCHAQ